MKLRCRVYVAGMSAAVEILALLQACAACILFLIVYAPRAQNLGVKMRLVVVEIAEQSNADS